VTTAPATGYISDVAGYDDCQEIDGGKVVVFKLKNGNYAKGIFTGVSKDGSPASRARPSSSCIPCKGSGFDLPRLKAAAAALQRPLRGRA